MGVVGMLYRMQVGCPRRDLPKALATDPDWEWGFIDGNYVKAHHKSAGAAVQET